MLPSGFLAQSVEQRTIKSGGRGFDSRRGKRFSHSSRAVFYINFLVTVNLIMKARLSAQSLLLKLVFIHMQTRLMFL